MSRSPGPPLEGAPYFNLERRLLMIEGSYQIVPTKLIESGSF